MLTRFYKAPKLTHYNLATNILRFLIKTKDRKIKYTASKNLKNKVDSDFANHKINRKSITSYILYLKDNRFEWSSAQQYLLAHPSDEAEIIAVNDAARQLISYRDLLNQIFDLYFKPALYIDYTKALNFMEKDVRGWTKQCLVSISMLSHLS